MYSIGDKIVYPMYGAGIIDSITEQTVLGQERQYYVMSVVTDGMQVMIPVDACDTVGVRDIIRKKDVDGVMEVLQGPSSKMSDNWNRRHRENMERLRTGDVKEVAGVVRDLLRMEQGKPLSAGEKKLLTDAKAILSSELSLVTGKSLEKIDKMICEAI